MYTDSHAHLDGKRFDTDRAEVIARANQAGVSTLLAIGNGDGPGTGTLDCAIKLAQQYDWVYATVGIHPHEAALAQQTDFDQLQRLARDPKVIAWGEIGLDYFYARSPMPARRSISASCSRLPAISRIPKRRTFATRLPWRHWTASSSRPTALT